MTVTLDAPGIPIEGIDPADAVQILGPNPDRYEWLLLRRTGIGSSESSILAGLNRYQSAVELWLDKTGQIPLVDDYPSEEAEMGALLEPVVRTRFANRHGLHVQQVGTFRSVRWPWMLANPDGLVSDGFGFEAKTCSPWLAYQWADGQTADHAELQAQWCMAVTGLQGWHVAVLIGGQHNEYRCVRRDPELIDVLVEVSRRFWHDHVIAGEPPEWGGSDAATALLKDWYPSCDPDSVVEIDPELRDDLNLRHDKTTAALKAAQADSDAIKNEVRGLLGDQERLVCGDDEIATWTNTGAFNGKRFAAAHPELAERYTQPVTVDQLDSTAVELHHPELYRRFRPRALRFKN